MERKIKPLREFKFNWYAWETDNIRKDPLATTTQLLGILAYKLSISTGLPTEITKSSSDAHKFLFLISSILKIANMLNKWFDFLYKDRQTNNRQTQVTRA